MVSVYRFVYCYLLNGLLFPIFANSFTSFFGYDILLGQSTWALLLPRCVNILRLMEIFDLLLISITLANLVVVLFLIFFLIHIWIIIVVIIGHSLFQSNAERSRKGKVVIVQRVRFVFVSYLTEQLVVIFLKCVSCLIRVMLSTYRLLLVTLCLKLICMLGEESVG